MNLKLLELTEYIQQDVEFEADGSRAVWEEVYKLIRGWDCVSEDV